MHDIEKKIDSIIDNVLNIFNEQIKINIREHNSESVHVQCYHP